MKKKKKQRSRPQGSRKRKELRNKVGSYRGIKYESLEEMAILQWLFELKGARYIKSIKRAPSFLLSDGLINHYAEQLKTKSRPAQQTLLQGHSYTPEFIVEWEAKGIQKFVWSGKGKFEHLFIADAASYTYIEVKPPFDRNNTERAFKLNQKWMWQKHGIFVNLVKTSQLFPRTFTPEEYKKTPNGGIRKLNWKAKSMNDYLNNR